MAERVRSPRVADAHAYLTALVDHEVSSVGISAGNIEGLSLEPARRVLEALGDPQTTYQVVHVTGTNGKGTVCRMVEAIVGATGLRVGAYLSPEGTVNERVRVDGRPLDDEALADAVESVRGAAKLLEIELTAFEAVTLTALVAFADAPVDVAVVEVGLLGRYDATNVVDGDVAVVTNVGGDHTDFAPGWRDKVASEKAGIIKACSIAVLGDVDDAVVGHFESEGPEQLVRLEHDFDCVENHLAVGGRRLEISTSRGSRFEVWLPLHGAHQGSNVAVAIEAAESVLNSQLSDEVIDVAFAELTIPGRLEVLGRAPLVVLDGAHNADAAATVGAALAEGFSVAGRRVAIVGMLRGRDPASFLAALHAEFALDLVVAVDLAPPRGAAADVIATAARSLGIAVVAARDIATAVARTIDDSDDDDLVLVTGSFRMIAPARISYRAIPDRRAYDHG